MSGQGLEPSPDVVARVDALFAEWDRQDSPGCALGIYRDGERWLTRCYGMANLEHGAPITEHSPFHVASISKQFTALCVALLAEDGALSLDDDVREHVPELPDFGHVITLRHLIHHTSGLRDQWDLLRLSGWRADDLITPGDVLDISERQTALNFPPGEQHRYSNTGYTLLSIITRRVSGLSLRQLAEERIFAPLGMTRTHFHDDHREIVPGRTHGYEPREAVDGRPPWEVSNPVFDVVGTTSLFTTVHDLFAWDRNYEHGQVGGDLLDLRQTPGALTTCKPMIYAFGLQARRWRGSRVVEHSGADAGYRAHYMRVPEHRLGVAILCNLSAIAPGQLAQRVVEILLAEQLAPPIDPPDAPPAQLSDEQLRRVAGVYRGRQDGQIMEVELNDGSLRLPSPYDATLSPLSERRLRAEGLRQFTVTIEPETPGLPQRMTFLADEDVLAEFDLVASEVPPLEPGELERLAGEYWSDELAAEYTFEADGDSLRWLRRKFEPVALRRALPRVFTSRGTTFEFAPGEDRDGDALTVSTTRAGGMLFRRR